ncbi:phosphatidylserine/phosphatidylglycerophosphate/cardiolipin synthase family protein [bacterium]|nr:phosphatidylserine/phosphatidylglycerophosphate/cardiolipin synthase family protein [bacterium]
MKRLVSVAFLILIFIGFLLFTHYETDCYEVLKVISPTEIIVDFNRNRIKDNNEVVIIPDIYSFSTKLDKNSSVIEILNLSKADSLRLGYLAEDFAKRTLEGKKIKYKNSEVYVDNNNYHDLLLVNGFGVTNGKNVSPIIKENLEKAKTLNLVIFNTKSKKYHTLDCEYGQNAKNIIILPKSQLEKGSSPCKTCIVNEEERQKELNGVANIAQPKLDISENNISLILSDMTEHLKPRKDCSDKICKALVKEIDSSKNSIDFAIYGYTKNSVIEHALKSAQARGVKIRFVFDTTPKNTNIYPDTLYFASIFKDNNHDTTGAIMHNKFFIFDDKTVLTGSANLSNSDMSGFNSNAVIVINSPDVAKVYKSEFEQMYNGKFHEQKSIVEKNNFSNLRVYFSPADKVITKEIIPLINGAKKYIYIPTFVITHENFAQSLIAAKKRGVDVRIILDSTNTKNPSKLEILRAAKIPVKTENYAGKLHSKSIIIDDKYLVIGSMNFSMSGENKNDENAVIIENGSLAKHYKTFFNYLWTKIPDIWLTKIARAESFESIGSCYDGIDNDFDGDTDAKDSGCLKAK